VLKIVERKSGRIRRVKNWQTTLAISAALLAAATVWAPPVPREPPEAATAEKQAPWENREAWWKNREPSEKAAAAERAASVQKAAFAAHPEFELLSKVVPGLSGSDVSIVDGIVKRFQSLPARGQIEST